MAPTVPLRPPDRRARRGELFSAFEVVRGAVTGVRSTVGLPRGDGAPVVLVPGTGATDVSMAPLAGFLHTLGHDVRRAELGRVTPDVAGQYVRLAAKVDEIHQQTGRVVSLVGWSIGGVLSREAARDRPDAVTRVITFGSPVVGGPKYTSLAGQYSDAEMEWIQAAIAERYRRQLKVPVTAIWSRRDGIVAPAACIDHESPDVEHVEVDSTHLAMGLDLRVWTVIAGRLAARSRLS
jgi:pimeloyl-ACP methyl ester carboxylesterase